MRYVILLAALSSLRAEFLRIEMGFGGIDCVWDWDGGHGPYNPASQGGRSMGRWLTAVMSMKSPRR